MKKKELQERTKELESIFNKSSGNHFSKELTNCIYALNRHIVNQCSFNASYRTVLKDNIKKYNKFVVDFNNFIDNFIEVSVENSSVFTKEELPKLKEANVKLSGLRKSVSISSAEMSTIIHNMRNSMLMSFGGKSSTFLVIKDTSVFNELFYEMYKHFHNKSSKEDINKKSSKILDYYSKTFQYKSMKDD